MTQENQTSQNTLLDAFLKQRAKRQNSAVVEAKKLVNLYRHLSLFGDDFLNIYNDMLLSATPEVQTALPDIVGGTIVRQYLEFLKGRLKQEGDNDIISEEDAIDAYQYRHTESYLPSPDEVPPFMTQFMPVQTGTLEANGDSGVVSTVPFPTSAFEQVLERQNTFLVQALSQLKHNISHTDGEGPRDDVSSSEKEKLSDLLKRQNEQMNANVNAILSQTQEISARQVAAFEKLMKKQNTDDSYMVIEEEAPVLPDTKKTNVSQAYMGRYHAEEPTVLHQTEIELGPTLSEYETYREDTDTQSKRHSSISLDDYFAEEPTVLPQTDIELKPTTLSEYKTHRENADTQAKRHSSISLDDYYAEEETLSSKTKKISDWKG